MDWAGARIYITIRQTVKIRRWKAAERWGWSEGGDGGIWSNLTTRSPAHKSNAGLLLPRRAEPQIKCIFLSYAVSNYWLQWFSAGYEKVGRRAKGGGEESVVYLSAILIFLSRCASSYVPPPPSFSLSHSQNHCVSPTICLSLCNCRPVSIFPLHLFHSLTSCPSSLSL